MNWDTETADKCKLPEYLPNACDKCRDYRYCHRQTQIRLDLFEDEQKGRRDDIHGMDSFGR